MQPVKLTISGDWWDSYIYASRLYLVEEDGSVLTVPWRQLVAGLTRERRLDELALELAFVDARYLYGEQWARLISDPEIQDVLTKKFARLATTPLDVTADDLERLRPGRAENLAPDAISDIEIHKGYVYFGSDTGLHAVSNSGLGGRRLEPQRLWDAELFRVKANGGVLALAAGSEGIFQRRAGGGYGRRVFGGHDDPNQLVKGDFFSCNWLGSSIYGSSYDNAGTLALFSQRHLRRERKTFRVFEAALTAEELFEPSVLKASHPAPSRGIAREQVEVHGEDVETAPQDDEVVFRSLLTEPAEAAVGDQRLSWAGYDIVCRAEADGIRIARYESRRKQLGDRFQGAAGLRLPAELNDSSVIAGDVTPFGVVIEAEQDLYVLSDDGIWQLGYEPVRWRTFSRATNYPNQLHVVAEDRLEIYSFNTPTLSVLRHERRLLGRTRR